MADKDINPSQQGQGERLFYPKLSAVVDVNTFGYGKFTGFFIDFLRNKAAYGASIAD